MWGLNKKWGRGLQKANRIKKTLETPPFNQLRGRQRGSGGQEKKSFPAKGTQQAQMFPRS